MSTEATRRSRAARIIFFNRFFFPDLSATAQILTDVAVGLARKGLTVSVVTSRLMYEDPDAKLPARETVETIDVIRVRTTRFGRAGLIGRALDYITFYLASLGALLRHARRGDVIVFKTDPPLLSIPLSLAARLKGARIVNWLQDIFPETAEVLGMRLAGPPLGPVLKFLRNRALKTSAAVVVIGARMGEYVSLCGVPKDRITEIPNFCDDAAIQPRPRLENPLRAAWGLGEDEFVIGYSGNLGRAHDVDTILRAAEALKAHPDIKFLFIGGGHLRQTLKEEAHRRRLNTIVLKPYQPRDQLALSLCVPDVHWVSLKSELEGFILPSKLYGIAAAGRPVLMIGDPDGDIGRIVRDHDLGLVVPIGAAETLAAKILRLRQSPIRTEAMGHNARKFIDVHASREQVIERWFVLLSRLLASDQKMANRLSREPRQARR